jgi:hypothetical protein
MNHTQHELATQFWMRYFWNSTDSPEKSDFFNLCESLCEATNRIVGSEATDGVLPVMCSASGVVGVVSRSVCVFCQDECEPAPTKRGWAHIRYGEGLHFDCAQKVVDIGKSIVMFLFAVTSFM